MLGCLDIPFNFVVQVQECPGTPTPSGGYGGGVLVLNRKKSPADITYDCQGISGPTPTVALAAANSSLQVSMTVLS